MEFIRFKVLSATDAQGRRSSTWAFYARKTDGMRGFVVAVGSYRFAWVDTTSS